MLILTCDYDILVNLKIEILLRLYEIKDVLLSKGIHLIKN